MRQAKILNLLPISGILILAGLLRLWHYAELPFTANEIHMILAGGSAETETLTAFQRLFRGWTNLAGEGEMAVKLPFVLLGMGSVGMIYLIGRQWFSETAGLLSAAFLAVLAFPVMYSQQAGPYVGGLFFVLLMVYAWHRFLFGCRQKTGENGQNIVWFWLVMYVLAGTACAYLHLFSFLMVITVFVGGIPFLRRKTLAFYLAAGALMSLLFLPGLSDALNQIRSVALEGWAEAQDPSSIRRLLEFSLQFSPLIYILSGVIWSGGLFLSWQHQSLRGRYYLIGLYLVSVPVLITYFYTAGKEFIPHHAIFLPWLPFLIFLITGLVPRLNHGLNLILLLLLLPLLLWSLTVERQYYRLSYASRYEQGIQQTQKTLEAQGTSNCIVLMDTDPLITEYYFDKLRVAYPYIRYYDSAAHELVALLDSSNQTYISVCTDSESDPALPGIIKHSFPRLLDKHDYYGGNFYLFARAEPTVVEPTVVEPTVLEPTATESSAKQPTMMRPGNSSASVLEREPAYDTVMEISRTITHQGFEEALEHWSSGIDSLYQPMPGRIGEQIYRLDPANEFSPTFSYRLSRLNMHPNDLIDVSVSVRSDSISQGMVVLAVHTDKGLLEWTGRHFQDYNNGSGEWYHVHHAYRPGRFGGRHDIELKIYVWNPGKEQFFIDDVSIRLREGNPVLYGLLEKI